MNRSAPIATILMVVLSSAPVRAGEVYDQVAQAGYVLVFGTEKEKLEAAQLLATLHAVYSVPVLLQALDDASPAVREAAVAALGRIAHPDAAGALAQALGDEDPAVAVAAATALGDMHIDASYKAMVKALPGEKRKAVKAALLEGLRKWNEPFTPLPEPLPLPEDKKQPPLPGEDLPVDEKTIDKTNPYGGAPPAKVTPPPEEKGEIDKKNPYGDYPAGEPSLMAALIEEGTIDLDNPYTGLDDVTPEHEKDTWGVGQEKHSPSPPPAAPAPGSPALGPLLELWDPEPASFVSLGVSTAAEGHGRGRASVLEIRGGYSGRYVGAGAVIPFGGASTSWGEGAAEEWVFGNLGLWFRAGGEVPVGPHSLHLGGALTMHVPSADDVSYDPDGTDPDLVPSVAGLYLRYYRHGLHYPDLEDGFLVAFRPDFDIALSTGPVSFQLELGFDFLVLGRTKDAEDPDWNRDLPDLALFHLGFATAVRPLPWLQLSLELTTVVEMAGRSARTWRIHAAPAGHEAFVTPGLTILVPVRDQGTAILSLGLRVPLGEIGSSTGQLELGPILVLGTGFRWDAP